MSMEALCKLIAARCAGHDQRLIALSGGVDSSLVAFAAHQALEIKPVAVTARSELTARRDFTRAVEIAEHIGLEHHPLPLRLLENKLIRRNNEDRCYHCKKGMFETMVLEYGDHCLIMDGTNSDDDPGRPGLRAAKEFNVISPLKEVGMTKADVRELAHSVGLPNWDAPSESCLGTRIPTGIPLSSRGLEQVQAMELFIHDLGVEVIRASHDNLVATVTHLPQYAEILDKNRDKFAALVERIGLRSYIFKEWRQ